jgi:hypothetical protein
MPTSHEAMHERISPLSPQEAYAAKVENFPDKVVAVFNEVITVHYHKGAAVFYGAEIFTKLEQSGMSRPDIYKIDFWCVEEIFSSAGWTVESKDVGGDNDYVLRYTFKSKAENKS